ncbi:MAG TPA: hypothetical protein VMU28_03130 [Terriglobales bacterium]|nr:hypothetical protein [Terriglobales bacterium]
MRYAIFMLLLAALCSAVLAQTPAPATSDDISGMYTFLQEGEFVQINIEDGSKVTGFISRYGSLDSDKGAFLDQMFSEGELKGKQVRFKTRPVHGITYEFSGIAELGQGKKPGEEGYRVLNGKLTQVTEDENKKVTAKSREVTLKSFPSEATADQPIRH